MNLVEAQRRAIRDRWIEIGLCTKPADRAVAEKAIHVLYRAAKLAPPPVVWFASPFALAMTRACALYERGAMRVSRHASVHASRGALGSAQNAVLDSIARNVAHAARPSPQEPFDAMAAQTARDVDAAVGVAVGGPVQRAIQRTARVDGAAPFRGQHEAAWFAFVDCRLSVLPPSCERERLASLTLLAAAAGWVLPHDGICLAAERHERVHRDERGRLHDASGPAVAYPDGWQLHFWHGVEVPAEWIEASDRVHPSLALTWTNLEQRRALAEILGWERVLAAMPTRVIHQSSNPSIGTLLECDLPGAARCRFLRVRCGTGRTFVLSVPRECRNAREANAWTYGLAPDEYTPEVRT